MSRLGWADGEDPHLPPVARWFTGRVSDDPRPEGHFSLQAVRGVEPDDEEVTLVRLQPDPYGGPFWDDEGGLSADFEDWEPLGMSRTTYDACARWCESPEEAERARLVVRLRHELPSEIAVE